MPTRKCGVLTLQIQSEKEIDERGVGDARRGSIRSRKNSKKGQQTASRGKVGAWLVVCV